MLRGAAWGLAIGTGAALVLRIAALFVPVADRWVWTLLAAAGGALLFAAGNALRPVGDFTAAEAADGCGLKERTVTALELAENAEGNGSEQNGPAAAIRKLQREDACRALRELDVKQIRTGSVRKQLLTALGCGALVITLLLIPNPRDREADVRKALRKTLKEGTEEIARAAEKDAEQLSPEKQSELRRLTEDLKRDLENSRDEGSREGQTADGTGTTVIGQNGQTASDSSGNKTGTLSTQKALTALKSAVNPAMGRTGTQTASSGAQGNTGQDGNQNGQGTPAAGGGNGNKAAGGAGEGSTNLEAEGGGQTQKGLAKGNRDPKYREAEYETIYDPERTEASIRDEMTNQNRLGNEESLQAETGPGKGSLGGSVPWDEVFREYEETETRSAERENLTIREKQWVKEYYSLLTEQQ